MASKGLRASLEGIQAAKIALTDKTWSQYKLAQVLGITRQPVAKFFAGESISRTCFVQICQQLGLSWQMVAGEAIAMTVKENTQIQHDDVEIDALVKKVRQLLALKINATFSTLSMLDFAQPIPLSHIYTDLFVYQEIKSQQWRDISNVTAPRRKRELLGLEAVSRYSKLVVLGKPGSGKTTFLQYLAIQCNKGEIAFDKVPILIKLSEFTAGDSSDGNFALLDYISSQFLDCGIDQATTETILIQGKGLILLDGLDEVSAKWHEQVTREISRFTQTYYKNKYVITCRLSTDSYRFIGFTYVEIADWEQKQIEAFIKKWMGTVASRFRFDGEAIANLLLNHLDLQENQSIRELAAIPLLLNFICLTFHYQNKFPRDRANFYERLIKVLLFRWDRAKGVSRNDDCSCLTTYHLQNILSQIAVTTFEQGNIFFLESQLNKIIHSYISQSVNTNILQLSPEVLLREIIVKTGLLVEIARDIYSFDRQIFQKYFIALNIVNALDEQCLNNLVNYLTEPRWSDVFLLTANLLASADRLLCLMKQKIDLLVAEDVKIQSYLSWLQYKSNQVSASCKAAVVRAFYLVCDRAFIPTHNYELELALVGEIVIDFELALDSHLTCALACIDDVNAALMRNGDRALALDNAHALIVAIDNALTLVTQVELKGVLEELKALFVPVVDDPEQLHDLWQSHHQFYSERLRAIIIQHRNLGHNWQFSKEQQQLLTVYYDANKLLINCLNNANNVSVTVRESIEETLLLPSGAADTAYYK